MRKQERDPREPQREEKEFLQHRLALGLHRYWKEQQTRFTAYIQNYGKHAQHDQSSHGNWARGRGGPPPERFRREELSGDFSDDSDEEVKVDKDFRLWVLEGKTGRVYAYHPEELGLSHSHGHTSIDSKHDIETWSSDSARGLAGRLPDVERPVVAIYAPDAREYGPVNALMKIDKIARKVGFGEEQVSLYISEDYQNFKLLKPGDLAKFKAIKAFDPFWEAESRQLVAVVMPILAKAAGSSVEGVAAELLGLSLGIDWLAPHEAALSWAIERSSTLADELTTTSERAAQRRLLEFIQTPGMELGDVVEAYYNIYGSESRALSAAITEITEVYAEGALRAYSAIQQQIPGLEIFKVWYTNEDDDVCPICRGVEGEEVPINNTFSNGLQRMPGHPGCRCWLGRIARLIGRIR